MAGRTTGDPPPAQPGASHPIDERVTLPTFQRRKERGEKIVVITAYDYAFARLLDAAGVDAILVGDSLGQAVLGYETTLPVTLDEMIHHAAAVRRGAQRALVVVDMPFLSYQVSPEEALRNAGRVLKETGAEAVKIEGGAGMAETVSRLVAAGIPVMGHIGLTPQSIHVLGGYRSQGRQPEAADRLAADARALSDAGAFSIVLELMPSALAARITAEVAVPTIGIGAGPHCDGQVLVVHDLLGMEPERTLRHVKRYAEVGTTIRAAVSQYAEEVRSGAFPTEANAR